MLRPPRESYKGYLHDITALGEAGIGAEFAARAAASKRGDPVEQLDNFWCQLVCLYFLGYRAAVPRWLLRLTFRFDTLGEFLVVAHGAIGVLGVVVGFGSSRSWGCLAASLASGILFLSLARAALADRMLLQAARRALQGWIPPTFQLHPHRFLARRIMTFTCYLLHDLFFLLFLSGYLVAIGCSFFVLDGHSTALLGPFYLTGVWCLAVLARDFSEPPCLLYLSNSGEFPDSRILSIRESAYPARVLTLVRREKPRVGLAYRSSYIRVSPPLWANLVWKYIVRRLVAACGTALLDFGEGSSEHLTFEVEEVRRRRKAYLSISRMDRITDEDLTWTGLLAFLRKQSAKHLGSIYGPSDR